MQNVEMSLHSGICKQQYLIGPLLLGEGSGKDAITKPKQMRHLGLSSFFTCPNPILPSFLQ
jgi:hypothetical protein